MCVLLGWKFDFVTFVCLFVLCFICFLFFFLLVDKICREASREGAKRAADMRQGRDRRG